MMCRSTAILCVGIVAQALLGPAYGKPYLANPRQKVTRGTGYSTKLAFDFGTAKSTVRPGFKPVTKDTLYTAAVGYGWSRARAVHAYWAKEAKVRSYGFGSEVLYCPYQAFGLAEGYDDCLWGQSECAFRVDVPKGDYFVYYLAGVPARGRFPGLSYFDFDLRLNDRVTDRVCIPMGNIFENRRYRVAVGDAGLTIGFAPQVRWLVNVLLVCPAAEVARVEECVIGPLEEDVYLLPQYAVEQKMRTLDKLPPEPTDGKPVVPTAAKKKGYLVFAREFMKRPFPWTLPTEDEAWQQVSLFATPGEYEPASVCVAALGRECRGVKVGVSALQNADAKSAIASANIRVWRVQQQWMSMRSGRGYSPGVRLQCRLAPNLLDRDIEVDVPSGTTQAYWLQVKVPEDAPAGTYVGAVRVEPANAPATDVPLRIRVLPFVLERDPGMTYGVFYTPYWTYLLRWAKGDALREQLREREAMEAQDLKEHGIGTFNFGGYGRWKIDLDKRTVAPKDPDFPGMAAAVRFYREAGCNGYIVGTPLATLYHQLMRQVVKLERPKGMKYGQQWHRPDVEHPPAVLDLLTQGARIVQEQVAKKQWPEFLYYILDESNPVLMRKLYSAVKKAPRARTFTTSANYVDAIGPWIDMSCSTGSFLARGDWKGEIRERAAKGEFQPWCYPNGAVGSYRATPARCRYVWGFFAWKMGIRGVMPWIYSTHHGKGNPFNDLDRDYSDHGFIFHGPDGLIPTLRWDGAREGMDDMAYVYTLTQYIAKASKSADPKARAAALDAEAALDYIRADVPEQYMGDEAELWALHNTRAYRWYVATHILKLQKLLQQAQ